MTEMTWSNEYEISEDSARSVKAVVPRWWIANFGLVAGDKIEIRFDKVTGLLVIHPKKRIKSESPDSADRATEDIERAS